MSEMVERVALAIWQARERRMPGRGQRMEPDAMDRSTGAWASVCNDASAAIEAMREPTPMMLDIGQHQYDKADCGLLDTTVEPLHDAWDVMIDEALTGDRAANLARWMAENPRTEGG